MFLGHPALIGGSGPKSGGGINPLFLIPTALTVVAFYKDVFEFGHEAAEFFRLWLLFTRELWAKLFASLSVWVPIAFPVRYVDLLTLWATLLASVGVTAFLFRQEDKEPARLTDLLESTLKLKRRRSFLVGALLTLLSSLVVLFPFHRGLGEASYAVFSGVTGIGVEALILQYWIGIAAFVLFVWLVLVIAVTPAVILRRLRTNGLQHSSAGGAGTGLVLIALTFVSVAFAIAFPEQAIIGGVGYLNLLLLLFSLVFASAAVFGRSALPLFQIASIVVVVFAVDWLGSEFVDLLQRAKSAA